MVYCKLVRNVFQIGCSQSAAGRILNLKQVKSTPIRLLSVNVPKYSEKRFYTDKHEWVSICETSEKSGTVGKVGISNYAATALGDIVYAQLPEIGMELSQKDECGALESVKSASEIYSPVSGKVVEKNSAAEETPGLINSSCYEKGWLFKISLSKPNELENLMDEKKYEEFLKTDSH